MKDKYYTVTELAEMLKVNSRTILKLINSKKIEAVNVGVGSRPHYRIFEGQYLKFLADSYEKIKEE